MRRAKFAKQPDIVESSLFNNFASDDNTFGNIDAMLKKLDSNTDVDQLTT